MNDCLRKLQLSYVMKKMNTLSVLHQGHVALSA